MSCDGFRVTQKGLGFDLKVLQQHNGNLQAEKK